MTQDEKANAYNTLVAKGDRVNRQISTIKTNVNRTDAQERELTALNKQLQILESEVEKLYKM